MGCGPSKTDNKEIKNNNKIDKTLREVKQENDNKVIILLLGSGESGKSTIARQMKIIHQNGFSEMEKMKYKTIIHSNIIEYVQELIQLIEKNNLPELEQNLKPIKEEIMELPPNTDINSELAEQITQLWENSSIQEAFKIGTLSRIPCSAEYFFNNIENFGDENYIPNETDILNTRARTTGILTTEFELNSREFTLIDVGGQRNERKKWINCFENVTAVLFVTSLSEYDQVLFEDENINRMHESLLLFEEIANSRWFKDTSLILFLNKIDLFKKKIKNKKLSVCFPDYEGGNDYDEVINYIKNKFQEKVKNTEKNLYIHYTCATDTKNVRYVFAAVKDIVIQNVSPQIGLC
ncbi:guanine nucleotide-binding protein g(o) subunit alpha [Anaeramoeba flamelloides]|uniref:Guanine nucleotide-binding protein g(O) subunit alpha n=1 Tax=Anaeramoeba flamelloides TaxID=1746091 RepID=A0ABQ8ZAT8_9EUKA|nr:guanine nucleotide-binding protein g(o) subunit alpha [Anaeramoeba flamelloides]